MAIAIIDLVFHPGSIAKLSGKHDLAEDDVRALIQWPARVQAAFDSDTQHGDRWLVLVTVGTDEFFAAILPNPWYDGERATRWELVTAYWL